MPIPEYVLVPEGVDPADWCSICGGFHADPGCPPMAKRLAGVQDSLQGMVDAGLLVANTDKGRRALAQALDDDEPES